MHEKKPKQIRVFLEQEIREDMEKYRQMALDMGMTDAKAIPAERVYVDTRVRFKCMIPKCPSYGSCATCPPHGYETAQIRELVSAFRFALLMKLNIDSSNITGDGLLAIDKEGNIVPTKPMLQLLKGYRKVADVVTNIESEAFYDGHYLALAFSAGSCKAHYCNFLECQVLKGMPCRFPLKSRPSMESSSMDVYRMAAEAGWEIFPIGSDCNPAHVPHGTLVGLVLVD
jgi:predicted metal-binding protein